MKDTFHELKKILKIYEDKLIVKQDTENAYYLNTPKNPLKENE